MTSDPVQQWEILMIRVRDLASKGFRLGVRVAECKGFGESTLSHEHNTAALGLCEELTAFLTARVENARKTNAEPSTNGAPKPAATTALAQPTRRP